MTKHKNSKILFLFLLLITCHLLSVAAPNSINNRKHTKEVRHENLDREQWSDLVDKADYWKNEKKEEVKPIKVKQMGEINLGFLKYIFIGLAIIIIVYILLRIFAAELFVSSKKIKSTTNFSIEDIESNLEEAPIQKLLREAIDNSNFKLAVRLYYLIILQNLNNRRLIKWHKEKTNANYLNEMREHLNFKEFKIVTHVFEYIWYGAEVEISKEKFNLVQPAFDNFIKAIER